MSSVSSISSREEGNTIPSSLQSSKQISPAIRWCFTLNNYTESEVSSIVPVLSDSCRVAFFAKEVGESGTPHLQGYLEFKKKSRPLSVFKSVCDRFHWEKAKGSKDDNLKYCTKSSDLFFFVGLPKPIRTIKPEQFYNYQKEIYDLIQTEPDDRTIHWYWEDEGHTGKSSFTKYLVIHHKAIVLSGKASDCFNGVLDLVKKGEIPEIIIFDIPRVCSQYVSYQAIEKVKDGCFFSGKYEGGMCVFNPPHIVCFANVPPEIMYLSADRWNINKIDINSH